MTQRKRAITGRGIAVIALWAGLLCASGSAVVHAQEAQGQNPAAASGEAGDPNATWKLINTGIFAVLLGWFLVKYPPRFFNARSLDIQKAIKDATGLKIDADFRYSEIDRRMAGLPAEVERLRREAERERAEEHRRIQRDTETETARILASAEGEIDALRQEAAHRVQLHTAQLALGLAEKRLLDRFAQTDPPGAVEDFIRLVERSSN